ncbi:MAG TPA: NFACT family protein [Planctomycetota bacterium]|nr:NFACT family protein [Planctomycetota bacterium]
MTLSLIELKHVVAELGETVRGAHVQKVQQPSGRSIVLQVRRPGATHHIYLGAQHNLARVHLLSRSLPNPPAPPAFCMALRKHLIPGIIESIEVLSDDRIVKLGISRREEDGAPGWCGLIVELVPGSENIILVDAGDKIITAFEHTTSKDGREIAPRRQYVLPAPHPPAPSPSLERGKEPHPPAPSPSLARGSVDRFEQAVRAGQFDSYSAAIEAAYAQEDTETQIAELRRSLQTVLSRSEKRLARRLEKIQKDFDATGTAGELARKGELLKANLGLLRRGLPSIGLPDPETGRTVTIELDPTRMPLENMQRCFKRARKLRAGRDRIKQRLDETRAELAALAELRSRLARTADLDGLRRIGETLRTGGYVQAPPRERPREVRSRPRKFISADGIIILVGRNTAQNDELTLHAAGNDWWLHVQQYPGSHVIIKSEKDKPLMKETLLDAAHLAVYFSQLRDAAKAVIDYTQRKHVRKPRGYPPGRVAYSQQKTILLVPDKRRLERLLKKGGTGAKDE